MWIIIEIIKEFCIRKSKPHCGRMLCSRTATSKISISMQYLHQKLNRNNTFSTLTFLAFLHKIFAQRKERGPQNSPNCRMWVLDTDSLWRESVPSSSVRHYLVLFREKILITYLSVLSSAKRFSIKLKNYQYQLYPQLNSLQKTITCPWLWIRRWTVGHGGVSWQRRIS